MCLSQAQRDFRVSNITNFKGYIYKYNNYIISNYNIKL